MLFQMLAGVLPFRGDSMAELMYKIANEPAPDIRIIRPELSEKLANIVALSISKRSETRYQDGDQLAADLRAVMADFSGNPSADKYVALSNHAPADAPRFDTTVVQLPAAGLVGSTRAQAAIYEAIQAVIPDVTTFEKTSVIHAADTASANGNTDTDIKL